MIESIIKTQNAYSNEVGRSDSTYDIKTKPVKSANAVDDKKYENKGLKEAIEQIDNAAKYFNRKIKIEVENDLNIMIVKVIDGETDQVIRQIPPEEIVALSKRKRSKRSPDKQGGLISCRHLLLAALAQA